ncbi:MAG: glycosyltransferase family 2 protein [Ignavibacteriales bacterium]|nr:glycosyltransferase family 2 protein [Ignavibacteriales bacterium]
MSEKNCAVVVTYNRLELLKECVQALRNQTRKLDEIIVVNNDSIDGTKEWLDEQKDLTKIHQENLGGAGGFHNGMKAAYEKGYDWIWLMDDDCLPEIDALENLFTTELKSEVVLNSVVVTKTNTQQLNFGLDDYRNKKLYRTYNEIKKEKTIFSANFFNGSLIHKNVIEKIGFPNPLFFIYGDEYEYYLRIKSNSFPILTVVSSIVKHPVQSHTYFGKGKFHHRFNFQTKMRTKYFPRNIFVISYLYTEIKIKRLIKTYISDFYGIFFIQKEPLLIFSYIFSILSGPILLMRVKNHDQRFIAGL